MSKAQSSDDGTILLVLKGMLVGIANIIPGVSGGTFALVLGIYDRLISSLKSIGVDAVKVTLRLVTKPQHADHRQAFFDEMKRIDMWFLIRLGVGAMVAIFGASFAVDWLLVNQPSLTLAFFVGLIVPSIAVPWRMMENKTPGALLWVVPGIALTVGVALAFSGDHAGSTNPLIVFVAGVAAISAMILPGISGSFLLLVIGQYRNVLGAIQGLQRGVASGTINIDAVIYLATLSVGCAVGLLAFARLLAWVLKRFRSATLAFLIGLVVGSFWVLWPFKDFEAGATVKGRKGEEKTEVRIATAPNRLPRSAGEVGMCGAVFALGLVAAFGVEHVGRRRKDEASDSKQTKRGADGPSEEGA